MVALARALAILDELLERPAVDEPRPVFTYAQLGRLLPETGDASRARLLKELVGLGVLSKTPDGYGYGERVLRWRRALADTGGVTRIAEAVVDFLIARTGESAAVGMLAGDEIRILAGRSVPGSISIIPAGGLLHFEADHAGALAILSQVPRAEQERLVAGPSSRLADPDTIREALGRWQAHGVLADRSTWRPGVSRVAIGLPGLASAFLCVPTPTLATKIPQFAAALTEAASRFGGGFPSGVAPVTRVSS